MNSFRMEGRKERRKEAWEEGREGGIPIGTLVIKL